MGEVAGKWVGTSNIDQDFSWGMSWYDAKILEYDFAVLRKIDYLRVGLERLF